MKIYSFSSIDKKFTFGRFKGLTFEEVLSWCPSYIDNCLLYYPNFYISKLVIQQIQDLFPDYIIPKIAEEHIANCCFADDDELDNDELEDNEWESDNVEFDIDDDYNNQTLRTYDCYNGSWAQDVEGYSDDDIDTIFDGDPNAYWNID